MLTTSKKLSTIVAALVIGILSIYATSFTFTSTNQTSYQYTTTLYLHSGAQVPVVLAPGQTVPTQINNDAVVGLMISNVYVPAGSNAIVPNANGGVQVMWQMAGSSAVGVCFGSVPGGGGGTIS